MLNLVRFVTNALFISIIMIVGVAFLLSGRIMYPPWYYHRTVEEGRTLAPKGSVKHDILHGNVHDPKIDFGKNFNVVSIPSKQFDVNVTLRGWHVPNAKSDQGVVFVHGGGGDSRDFLRQLPIYYPLGYELLYFDCNGMGISGGKSIGVSYGFRESVDAYHAIIGGSVGAASALVAAGRNSTLIDAIIVENPFTAPLDLWYYAITKQLTSGRFGRHTSAEYGTFVQILFKVAKFVPEWFKELVGWIAYVRIAGFLPPATWEPIELARSISPTPLFIIHSQKDDMIPHSHSHGIFNAAKEPKELWIKDNGGHAQLYEVDKAEYESRIHAFLKKHNLN